MQASSPSPRARPSRLRARRATSDPSVRPPAFTSASSARQDTLRRPSAAPPAPRASLGHTLSVGPLPVSRAALGPCRLLWLARRPRSARRARLVLGRQGTHPHAIFVVLVRTGVILPRCSSMSRVSLPSSTTPTSTSVSPSAASMAALSWLRDRLCTMWLASLGP